MDQHPLIPLACPRVLALDQNLQLQLLLPLLCPLGRPLSDLASAEADVLLAVHEEHFQLVLLELAGGGAQSVDKGGKVLVLGVGGKAELIHGFEG